MVGPMPISGGILWLEWKFNGIWLIEEVEVKEFSKFVDGNIWVEIGMNGLSLRGYGEYDVALLEEPFSMLLSA